MTGIPQLTAASRAEIRRRLRARAGEFLQRFYRHDVLMARAVRGVQIEAAQQFRREVADPLVREIAGRLVTFDARGHAVTPEAFPELGALIREAEAIVERGVESVRRMTEERMADIARGEAEFVAKNAEKVTEEPQQAVSTDRVTRQPFYGDSTEQWFRKMLTAPTSDAVRQRITRGIQEGQTVDQIVRSIRGTRTTRGVLDARIDEVSALVVTAATSISANSRFEGFKALGVDKWRWLDTLDSKTCIICAARAKGSPYLIGEGPTFPAHPRCRCSPVPWFGDPIGTRASVDGQVPADTDLESWLATQPHKEQDKAFGKTKADAWRAGKLTMRQMLDRDLQPLTLADLRRLDRIE